MQEDFTIDPMDGKAPAPICSHTWVEQLRDKSKDKLRDKPLDRFEDKSGDKIFQCTKCKQVGFPLHMTSITIEKLMAMAKNQN